MKISVVIPTYNRATVISRAIESVAQQSCPPDEIIVVDDGSNDDTEQLITQKFPQCRYIKQANHGVSHARNTGIEAAHGDWVALLDSDDYWLPDKLLKQKKLIKSTDNNRICHSEEIWIRNGKRVNAMKKHAKSGGNIYLNCLPLCVISPSSALLHKTIFTDYGNFDESLPACEDYDLWLRVCAHEQVAFVEEPQIIKTGGHADQLSHKHWGMDRFRIKALDKMLHESELTDEYRDATISMVIEKCNILLIGAKKRKAGARVSKYQNKIKHYLSLKES